MVYKSIQERREHLKRWKHKDKERYMKNWARNMVYSSRHTDKKKHMYDEIHHITENFVERIYLFQKHKCYYCDKEMQTKNRQKRDGCTIERLDNNFGHTIKNCVLACFECNIKKH